MKATTKTRKFATFAEHLPEMTGFSQVLSVIAELECLTQLIHARLPELREIVHCGALDREEELLVLYTSSNAAFYQINNSIPLIQDCLLSENIRFNKIMVKTNPNKPRQQPKTRHVVDEAKHQILAKFAAEINRPDLLKPLPSATLEDERDSTNEPWRIEL